MRWWAVLAAMVLAVTGAVPVSRAGQLTARERLHAAKTWVSYYGAGNLAGLANFDVVDIDVEEGAANYNAADVAQLKQRGAVVLAYLNVGSAEPFRSYWSRVQPFVLAQYPGWPEYYMDVSKPGFRQVLLGTVVPQLLAKGVDGLFLDNVDAGSDNERQDVADGVVEFVRALRAARPDTLIVAQSFNLRVLDQRGADGRKCYEYLDGLAREEVSATYVRGYHRIPVGESDLMLHTLAAWRAKGLAVFTLDYANTADLARYAIARARAFGLVPYAATRELNQIFSW
jgi:cysteinyl-tRNA synthetase, unknown class